MKEVPESVIISCQERVYKIRDELIAARAAAGEAEHVAEVRRDSATYVETQLREMCDFLQEHNADARRTGETWHDIFAELWTIEAPK